MSLAVSVDQALLVDLAHTMVKLKTPNKLTSAPEGGLAPAGLSFQPADENTCPLPLGCASIEMGFAPRGWKWASSPVPTARKMMVQSLRLCSC